MRCPICDHQVEKSKKSCPTCGSKFKVVQATMEGKVKRKLRLPIGKLLLGLGMGLCAVALCFLLPSLFLPVAPVVSTPPETLPPNNQPSTHIPYQHHFTVATNESKLTVYYDHNALLACGQDSYNLQTNFSGTAAAMLTGNGNLWRFDGQNSELIAMYAWYFRQSTNSDGLIWGNSLIPITEGDEASSLYSLSHYANGTIHTLVQLGSTSELVSAVISPDGMTVAYILNRNGEFTLMCAVAGGPQGWETRTIPMDNTDYPYGSERLLAVSDDGEYIYTIYSPPYISSLSAQLRCYDLHGNCTVLGQTDSIAPLYFNADHRELLFYCDYETYLSVDGKAGKQISQHSLTPVVPVNANVIWHSNGISQEPTLDTSSPSSFFVVNNISYYPFQSFYNHLYTGKDGANIRCTWYLTQEECSKTTPGPIQSWCLDPAGENFYYISGQSLFCLPTHKDYSEATLIDADVNFAQMELDPTGENLYYIKNGVLYCYTTESTDPPRQIYRIYNDSDAIIGGDLWLGTWHGADLFQVDANGNVHILAEQSLMVYLTKEDRIIEVISSGVSYIYGSPNGIITIDVEKYHHSSYRYMVLTHPDGQVVLIQL